MTPSSPLPFKFSQPLCNLLGDDWTIAPCPVINDKIHLLSPPDPRASTEVDLKMKLEVAKGVNFKMKSDITIMV
jgi:hypothetical protein